MTFAIRIVTSSRYQVIASDGTVVADYLDSETDAHRACYGIVIAYNLGKEDKLAELREFLGVPRK